MKMRRLGFSLLAVAVFALVLGACTAAGDRTDNGNTNGPVRGGYGGFSGGYVK
jgi:hypothetical protein